jgi:hypothetical protein
VALLTAEIENTRWSLSPRIRKLRAIFDQAGPGCARPEPYPAPKPPREPIAMLEEEAAPALAGC